MRPSVFSIVTCAFLTCGIIVGANWSFVLDNILFYDYFFGSDGLVTSLRDSSDSGTVALNETLTGNSVKHSLAILGGALLVGVGLALLLWLIKRLVSNISMTIREMSAVEGPAKTAVEHELEKRIGIRFLVALIWVAFVFISIEVILPFCILASRVALEKDSSVWEGIGNMLFSGVLLFVMLHLHVVLARLFLLRPRVFGSQEAVLTD
jgi:hypothetical protein